MVATVDTADFDGVRRNVNTLPALGQSNKAGSLPVALASDQDVLNVGGLVADGSAPTTNAVRVSGIDTVGNKRTFLTDLLGRVYLSLCIPYNDSTSILAGAATFTGTARDSAATTGTTAAFGYFNAFFFADQLGTASIEGSWDNSTWTKLATAALAVSTPLTLQVPAMFRYHRVKLVNGATLQTVLQIASSYTAS